MEPGGCNPSQPVANRTGRRPAQTRRTIAVGGHGLPIGAHGKEGVSGSSPEEGSEKLRKRAFFSLD